MVEVFKTNVQTEMQALELQWALRHHEIEGWSFDLEDCDKVLRVMSRVDVSDFVMTALVRNGYECCKLDW